MARKTSAKKPVLPKSERQAISREHEQRPMRGKRKPKFKTRQIDVSEWLPSGRKKPQRRVWRTFPKEKCVAGVSSVCRYCSVGQPLELFQGRGKAILTDPSIIEGYAVIGPNKKTAMQVRKTGRGYEYFLARFPTEEEAWDHAEALSYACEEGLALAEGREAFEPTPKYIREHEKDIAATEAQIQRLKMTLPSDLLYDIGLLPRSVTPEQHAKMVKEGEIKPGAKFRERKAKKREKPKEIYTHPIREWEQWKGEEEADIIHQRHLHLALQRVREKRRESARTGGLKPTKGYANVITLSSRRFQWGG